MILPSSRKVVLADISDDLMPEFYRICVLSDSALGWRYHGSIPSFQQFCADFTGGVHNQLAVREPKGGGLLGLVVSYGYDPINLTTKVGVVVEEPGVGIGGHAGVLFVDYLFRCWPLRKIYFEVPETNLDAAMNVLSNFAEHEATLRDHLVRGDETVAQHIFSIARETGSKRVSDAVREIRT